MIEAVFVTGLLVLLVVVIGAAWVIRGLLKEIISVLGWVHKTIVDRTDIAQQNFELLRKPLLSKLETIAGNTEGLKAVMDAHTDRLGDIRESLTVIRESYQDINGNLKDMCLPLISIDEFASVLADNVKESSDALASIAVDTEAIKDRLPERGPDAVDELAPVLSKLDRVAEFLELIAKDTKSSRNKLEVLNRGMGYSVGGLLPNQALQQQADVAPQMSDHEFNDLVLAEMKAQGVTYTQAYRNVKEQLDLNGRIR